MTEKDQVFAWIDRASRGNRASFEALVERYQKRLGDFVRSRIRPELRAQLSVEELVHETFARALESLERFSGATEDAFLGWLAGIAKHVVLKEIDRLHKGYAFQVSYEAPAGSPSPSKVLRREERFDRLKDALDSLSPDHKEAIFLCRIEGLRIQEVAKRMNRSPDAVKKLLWRGLKELKARFGETDSLHLPDRRLGTEGEHDGE